MPLLSLCVRASSYSGKHSRSVAGALYSTIMSASIVALSGPTTSLGASYEDGAKKAKMNVSLEYDPENPKALRAWIIKAESSLNDKGVLFALQEPPPSQRQ